MSIFSRQVIGVDLGHSSVKVVALELGKQPTLVGYAEVPVDAKYLQKEGFSDPGFVANALKEAMKSAMPKHITGKEAYAVVSEGQIFRKILELPKSVTEEEMQQMIKLQAGEYLPESIDMVELDYEFLGQASDPSMQQVGVVAVSKRVVQDYSAVFALAKLQLRAIEPKPSAAGRALIEPSQKVGVMVVDIGSEISTISVYSQRTVWVTGTVNLGGNMLKDPETQELYTDGFDDRMKRLASNLADELDHVEKFYANRAGKISDIKEIHLTGGGSMAKGLPELLEQELGKKVVSGKPYTRVIEGLDRRFYGALGAALYSTYEKL